MDFNIIWTLIKLVKHYTFVMKNFTIYKSIKLKNLKSYKYDSFLCIIFKAILIIICLFDE